MGSILIIEDDVTFSRLLQNFLQRNGYTVEAVPDIKSSKKLLDSNGLPDVILLDYRLPDGFGMDVLHYMRDRDTHIPTIVMTSFHDIRTAVRTIRSGAYDYITKPVNPDELLLTIKEAAGKKNEVPGMHAGSSDFVKGNSAASQKFYEYLHLVAPTDFSVIIQGESGTGKEAAARSIHNMSKRSKAPFIALDSGALSAELAGSELFGHVKGAFTGAVQNKRGMFEQAHGGTLFLDEVGNLSYEIQVKLLRAMQERVIQPVGGTSLIKVDVRVICATNENLSMAVKNGKFREDLYHRLNEFTIHIPSLNERKEDIGLFVDFFIAQTNKELGKSVKGISQEVLDVLQRYDWPGNLRELRNIIRRGVLLADRDYIGVSHLPEEMTSSNMNSHAATDLREITEMNERDLILSVLQKTKFNKTKAAKLLNIDRTTLYYKLAKYHIE